jgi:ElaB/YqjD/DUF883 family membrane-anchored ribosome-binding protein
MKVTIVTVHKGPKVRKQQTETQQLTTLLEELLEEVAKENKQEEIAFKKKSRICIVS